MNKLLFAIVIPCLATSLLPACKKDMPPVVAARWSAMEDLARAAGPICDKVLVLPQCPLEPDHLPHPDAPLIVRLPASPLIGATEVREVAVGASFFCSFGWIRLPDDLVTVDDTRPLGVREMQIAAQGTARAHFDLGSAVLTPEGRQALRRLCAAELPWFLRDDTHVTLTAHCDLVRFRRNSSALATSDTQSALTAPGDQAKTDDLRNMKLATYRAANVKQAIKDILGDRLKIPDNDKGLEERPMGKQEAEEAKRKGYEPYRNPHRRRVDVTMNGRHVLTLTEA